VWCQFVGHPLPVWAGGAGAASQLSGHTCASEMDRRQDLLPKGTPEQRLLHSDYLQSQGQALCQGH
jgi:hypothetical protein